MSNKNHRCFAVWIVGSMLFAAVGCGASLEPTPVSPKPGPNTEALATLPPNIPPELAVPEGNTLAFSFGASGMQRYACPADGSKWTLVEPQAELFDGHGSVTGHHSKGPTWALLDGSSVVGAQPALGSVVVDAGSIPWLKLGAASHVGTGRMTAVTFVQRLNTKGGTAPAGTCTPGGALDVDYTATYAFYEAAH